MAEQPRMTSALALMRAAAEDLRTVTSATLLRDVARRCRAMCHAMAEWHEALTCDEIRPPERLGGGE
jgi:hypothetical protein